MSGRLQQSNLAKGDDKGADLVRAGFPWLGRDRFRYLGPGAAAVIVLGIADSMSGSYMVLFASDEADLEPFEVGVFISLSSISGIVISHFAGRRFDRAVLTKRRWTFRL